MKQFIIFFLCLLSFGFLIIKCDHAIRSSEISKEQQMINECTHTIKIMSGDYSNKTMYIKNCKLLNNGMVSYTEVYCGKWRDGVIGGTFILKAK